MPSMPVMCIRMTVAPVRERGLKYAERLLRVVVLQRRSREGAWIEINVVV